MAELLDSTARRKDDGERDYGDGAAAVASAMAWESEGERQGENGRVHGVRGTTWGRPGQQTGEGRKQGSGQLRGARWCCRRAPACLPGEGKQLAGAAAGLGRLVGWLGGLPG